MHRRLLLGCWNICLLLLACVGGLCADEDQPQPTPAWVRGPSPEIAAHAASTRQELCRVRLVNNVGGLITGSRDEGKTWELLGSVQIPATALADHGFTAGKWANAGTIAASAVNGLHVCAGHSDKGDEDFLFSICPKEIMTDAGQKLQSFMTVDSTIFTDIPGGSGIFGGFWAPAPNNPVSLEQNGELKPLPQGYVPKIDDILILRVMVPTDLPKAIIFENRFSGFITEIGWDDHEHIIGQVLKPVMGIGRFFGSQYADVGELRANHSGVICISVSPKGQLGGFQIIPKGHAMSPEMVNARRLTQWMVVGPLDARAPSWEGVAPLFRDYLRPCWVPGGESVYVDIRVKDGPWQPIPPMGFPADETVPLPAWADMALEHVTHIRISFPHPFAGPPAQLINAQR